MKVMFRYNYPYPSVLRNSVMLLEFRLSDDKMYDVISYFNVIDPMTMKPHKK